MVSVKELKSIDLSSYTIICTAVSVLLTALISVAMAIGIMILAPDASGIGILIIPTLVVGAFMAGIYRWHIWFLF